MIRRTAAFAAVCVMFLFGFTAATPLHAQTSTGEIHGTVTDPSGALIPSATIELNGPEGVVKSAVTGRDGTYHIAAIAPGTYQLAVSALGFAPLTISDVVLTAGKSLTQNVTLEIPVAQQQVEVNESTIGVSTVADSNASSIVIKGKDLSALSDDPDQLQSELQELAGPAAGPNGAQIYIDGFSNGQLPPKSSIREIRVNQNPFSAQFDKLGYGRIEILTKPGTDKLHGNVMVSGNDSSFNSLNPFVSSEPPYHSTFFNGGVGGSLNARTSWFASVFRRDNASNSVITASLPDSSPQGYYTYSAAVATPQSRMSVSPRFDFQLGDKNTLTVRYQFERNIQTNSGVSGFALQSQGYDSRNYEHTVQLSDSQVIRSNIVNETRLQYAHESTSRTPYNTTPTVSVSGSFTSGGNSQGKGSDIQNRIELLNFTTIAAGTHAIQLGGRLRLNRYNNTSTSGFNGRFSYRSLDDYDAHTPYQYTVTIGNPTTNLSTWDLALFYQDDYKFNPNLTLSYGLRWESQNYLSKTSAWAPRVSLAWAPWGAKGKTVIRAGYGWFYDRFSSNNILNSLRLNGSSTGQLQYVINNPTFYEGSDPALIPKTESELSALNTAAPTIYQLSPTLRSSLNMQAAAGIEHQWGRFATTSVTYVGSRGVHQYLSENVNAYLPGTYESGKSMRPNGINENIYQYQSGGIYKQNQLMTNYSIQGKRLSLFGFYVLTFANANTSGAGYFSSNPFNPAADYGRANFDVRHRFMFGGTLQAPYGFTLNPMLELTSGSPFNIEIGQDLNGDSQNNDRPAWATASSQYVQQTAYGTFDINPSSSAARIPYNIGEGPSQFGVNLRLSKSIGIGPKVEGRTQNGGGFGGGRPGGSGRPGGGGLGPGGLSGSRNMAGSSQTITRKYSLSFTALARNALNHQNLAPPVGVLSSNFFGQSTRIAGGMFGSSASNRSIELQLSFNF